MNALPGDVLINIFCYLRMKEMHNIIKCSKLCYIYLYDTYVACLKEYNYKMDILRNNFDCDAINSTFGSYRKLIDHHFIEFDNKWMGPTDYIDKVNLCDINKNIVYGLDTYKRPFVIIKVIHAADDIHFIIPITIFRRYSGDTRLWVIGGDVAYIFGTVIYNDYAIEIAKDLIEGQKVKDIYWLSPK